MHHMPSYSFLQSIDFFLSVQNHNPWACKVLGEIHWWSPKPLRYSIKLIICCDFLGNYRSSDFLSFLMPLLLQVDDEHLFYSWNTTYPIFVKRKRFFQPFPIRREVDDAFFGGSYAALACKEIFCHVILSTNPGRTISLRTRNRLVCWLSEIILLGWLL